MLNYAIDPALLAPLLPTGTELDMWNGTHYISVVGFLFLETRIMGIAIPFHRNFEEVNLRFYVRRKAGNEWRRGVVFIREIVPRAAIAFTARTLYNEPYLALPMEHQLEIRNGVVKKAQYSWGFKGERHSMSVTTRGNPGPLREGSEAEFITEHYWGYNRQRNGTTLEYQVDHPRWRVDEAVESRLECNAVGLYGAQFGELLRGAPSSAFVAAGSEVAVYRGIKVTP